MDNCYYINLMESTERNRYMQNQLSKNNININRVQAIRGHLLRTAAYRDLVSELLEINPKYLKDEWLLNRSNFKTLSMNIDYILPRFGLYLSTIRALIQARNDGHSSCVILEDDCEIVKPIRIPDINADIIYLGATFQGDRYTDGDKKIIKVEPDKIKLFGTFGYYVKDIKSMLRILKSPFQIAKKGYDKHKDWRSGHIKLRCQNIDNFYKNYFQKYGNCYFLNPCPIIHPHDNISTINTASFDYNKNGLRFLY